MGQRNAVRSAKVYLEALPMSYGKMITQLEFEGYATEDAAFGAKNCDADWNAEAAECAKLYLDMMGYSKDNLITQLEYEGFTHEQAVYGVEANGY